MVSSQFLETERLLLRRWTEADRPSFAAMNADNRVMEHFPALLLSEESDALADRIELHFADHGFGLWAVEVKSNTQTDGVRFAGFIGLATPQFEAHFTPCVEIGWRLAADQWGQGFATEGATAVLEYAFQTIMLDEVVAMTAVENTRSRRVMEKLGMKRNPDDDFDHPLIESNHRLCRHVLYRIASTA